MDDYLEDIVTVKDEQMDFIDSMDDRDELSSDYWLDDNYDIDEALTQLLDDESLDENTA